MMLEQWTWSIANILFFIEMCPKSKNTNSINLMLLIACKELNGLREQLTYLLLVIKCLIEDEKV